MRIAVIGGGPAGLRAAEVAASGGAAVTLFDAMASVGRKFLVAGRGGLNLTNLEPAEQLARRYMGPEQPTKLWPSLIAEFDAKAVRAWSAGLGVETIVASSGRIYPRELKAAPLLRRWVQRLHALGVHFRMRHRWCGLRSGASFDLEFQTGGKIQGFETDAVIFALGGGSWPQTGSDAAWTPLFEKLGVTIAPLIPANCGWEVAWPSEVLAQAEGQPLKNITASAGEMVVAGELLITRYGLEGGAIYQLGPTLRRMPEPLLSIDFKPTFTIEQLVAKLGPVRGNYLAEARRRWRLNTAASAILSSCTTPEQLTSAETLAAVVKACAVRLHKPRSITEAISSAGGLRWRELDAGLMLRRWPGLFIAGEMIDWEAPTGGYLIQGCLATGTRAGRAAVEWLQTRQASADRENEHPQSSQTFV